VLSNCMTRLKMAGEWSLVLLCWPTSCTKDFGQVSDLNHSNLQGVQQRSLHCMKWRLARAFKGPHRLTKLDTRRALQDTEHCRRDTLPTARSRRCAITVVPCGRGTKRRISPRQPCNQPRIVY
jgi:hypothetical protein